ncbi:hypothetical protein [Candidatus Nitrosocosmicus sp. R]
MSTCIAISLNQITPLILISLSEIKHSSNAGDTAKVWENNVEEISRIIILILLIIIRL